MKRLLIPVPTKQFDPSEVTIPWKILTANKVSITFATPTGSPATCDQIMLTGKGLGLFSGILACTQEVKVNYEEMSQSEQFLNPLPWSECKADDFDGILLPGGHDKGCIEYLESTVLQDLIRQFFEQDKTVGAVCHGVVLVGRSKRSDGKSVLYGRKTTSLLAQQELAAYRLTWLWMGDYYLTYPITVEDEVKTFLENSTTDFIPGKAPGITRDCEDNYHKTNFLKNHVVRDGNYLSARWPGDCHLFGHTLLDMLNFQK